MTTFLNRDLAPIPKQAWDFLDDQARDVLSTHLSGRRVFQVAGPRGLSCSALDLGQYPATDTTESDGVEWGLRKVQPFLEAEAAFKLERRPLQDIARGRQRLDVEPLENAARKMAAFEERAIYEGILQSDLPGAKTASPHKPLKLPKKPEDLPEQVSRGLEKLESEGIKRPYALVLERDYYFSLQHAIASGVPILKHIHKMLDGPVLWSPGISGGLLTSCRGDEFEFVLGQDMSLGYRGHDNGSLEFYLMESFAFRPIEPAAAIALA